QAVSQARQGCQRNASLNATPRCHHAPGIQWFGHRQVGDVDGHKPDNARDRTAACQTLHPSGDSGPTSPPAHPGSSGDVWFARRPAFTSDWPLIPPTRVPVNPTLFVVLILAVLVLVSVAWYRLRGRRQREMHLLLDSADALEARLRTARAEIEAVAGEAEADPIHEAMREMLR